MMWGASIRAVPSSPVSPIPPLKDRESLTTPSLPLLPSRLLRGRNTGYTFNLAVDLLTGSPLFLAQPRRESRRHRETGLITAVLSLTVTLLTVSRSTRPR